MLVAQLAQGGDPLLDNATSSVSTRRAAQRAKLQEELASGRGVFFRTVLQNMARRMNPAVTPESDPAALLHQDVCLSKYWERFGGFGSQRDLALLAHQLAHALDAMQAGRVELAQDHMALMAVALEQAVMDSGRMDLAFQLTLLEEPPAAMFTARPQSSMLARAFAPLAAQRWVTVVLGALKELDAIQVKRADLVKGGKHQAQGSGSHDSQESEASQRRPPKRQPKKKPQA